MFDRMKKAEESQQVEIADLTVRPLPETLKTLYTLEYAEKETKLSDAHKDMLLGDIIPQLDHDQQITLQIEAYATPLAGILNSDKRRALDRGMAIRNYLIENAIDSTRINIRSLGDNTDKEPVNRVDVTVLK
jgi:hypothetical protein